MGKKINKKTGAKIKASAKINKLKFAKIEASPVAKFRKAWLKKGYELINITTLCDAHLGYSGWCNNFDEPEESIHHVQLRYRDETIANLGTDGVEIIDDDVYVCMNEEDNDFIIFRKVKLNAVHD